MTDETKQQEELAKRIRENAEAIKRASEFDQDYEDFNKLSKSDPGLEDLRK